MESGIGKVWKELVVINSLPTSHVECCIVDDLGLLFIAEQLTLLSFWLSPSRPGSHGLLIDGEVKLGVGLTKIESTILVTSA